MPTCRISGNGLVGHAMALLRVRLITEPSPGGEALGGCPSGTADLMSSFRRKGTEGLTRGLKAGLLARAWKLVLG